MLVHPLLRGGEGLLVWHNGRSASELTASTLPSLQGMGLTVAADELGDGGDVPQRHVLIAQKGRQKSKGGVVRVGILL